MLLAIQHPAQHLHQEAVVLLLSTNLDTFLIQIKTNATLRLLVKGILVDPSGRNSSFARHQISSAAQACCYTCLKSWHAYHAGTMLYSVTLDGSRYRKCYLGPELSVLKL